MIEPKNQEQMPNKRGPPLKAIDPQTLNVLRQQQLGMNSLVLRKAVVHLRSRAPHTREPKREWLMNHAPQPGHKLAMA